MSSLAVMSIILGILMILSRAPLIFWPDATASYYRRVASNERHLRIAGVFTGVLSLAMIFSSRGAHQKGAWIILVIGLFLALVAAVEIALPPVIGRIAESVWNIGGLTARLAGVFSVGVGICFICLGFCVF